MSNLEPQLHVQPGSPDPTSGTPLAGKKKGLPVGKIALGCGCLTLLMIGGSIALLVFVGGAAWKSLQQENEGLQVIGELLEAIGAFQEIAEAEKNAKKEGAGDSAGNPSGENDKFDIQRWDEASLTTADAKMHLAFMKSWEESDQAKAIRDSSAKLRAGGDKKNADPSAVDQLKTVRDVTKWAKSGAEGHKAFDQLAQQYGGEAQVMRRLFAMIPPVVAAEDIAEYYKLDDPASDAVAEKMAGERPAWNAKFDAWKEMLSAQMEVANLASTDPKKAQKLVQSPDYQQAAKAVAEHEKTVRKTPGLFLLGMMPEQSLKTWQDLDPKTRKVLIENYTQLPSVGALAFLPPNFQQRRNLATYLLNIERGRLFHQTGP